MLGSIILAYCHLLCSSVLRHRMFISYTCNILNAQHITCTSRRVACRSFRRSYEEQHTLFTYLLVPFAWSTLNHWVLLFVGKNQKKLRNTLPLIGALKYKCINISYSLLCVVYLFIHSNYISFSFFRPFRIAGLPSKPCATTCTTALCILFFFFSSLKLLIHCFVAVTKYVCIVCVCIR